LLKVAQQPIDVHGRDAHIRASASVVLTGIDLPGSIAADSTRHLSSVSAWTAP